MAIEIELQNIPHYITQVTLDSVNYILEFHWSSRGNCWYMNIYSSAEVLIIAGIKICNMVEMIHRYNRESLPKGYLVPMFTKNFNVSKRIEQDDIPNNVSLFYMDESEYNLLMSYQG